MQLFGLIFELPLIFLLLARAGVVSVDFLVRQRRLAILLSAVIAAFHADLVTMTVIAIPIYAMYELSIVLIRMVGEGRRTTALTPATATEAEGGPPGEED